MGFPAKIQFKHTLCYDVIADSLIIFKEEFSWGVSAEDINGCHDQITTLRKYGGRPGEIKILDEWYE